jgi:hypothetical protein
VQQSRFAELVDTPRVERYELMARPEQVPSILQTKCEIVPTDALVKTVQSCIRRGQTVMIRESWHIVEEW